MNDVGRRRFSGGRKIAAYWLAERIVADKVLLCTNGVNFGPTGRMSSGRRLSAAQRYLVDHAKGEIVWLLLN